ncbi:MAG: hypothetical protein V1689_02895 [Pseudomonadota bacterium]
MGRSSVFFLSGLLALPLCWCGGLRYSHVTAEGKDYLPKRVCLLPADVGPYEEARGGIIDEVVAGVVVKKGWFSDVIAGETMNRLFAFNEDLRKGVMENHPPADLSWDDSSPVSESNKSNNLRDTFFFSSATVLSNNS